MTFDREKLTITMTLREYREEIDKAVSFGLLMGGILGLCIGAVVGSAF